jgi:hypothetical protein
MEWYQFGFDTSVPATCDGNFEDIDIIYGGWDADAMQASAAAPGPRTSDRLIDWAGAYNLYLVCPSSYGAGTVLRSRSPSLETFLHDLAEADGAYRGPQNDDASGLNEIGFVFREDMGENNNPRYEGHPGHFSCTADNSVTPAPSTVAGGGTAALSMAVIGDGSVRLRGSLHGSANVDYMIDLYGSAGCVAPYPTMVPIGSSAVMTDNQGSANLDESFRWDGDAAAVVAEFRQSGGTEALVTCRVADADDDHDGISSTLDNCPRWSNADQSLPAWPVPADDPDCDGWSTSREQQIGTDPASNCNSTSGANDESQDAWPTDFNDSRSTNLSDLALVGPVYNQTTGTDPAKRRFDLNASGTVNLSDVVLIGPFYNRSCN